MCSNVENHIRFAIATIACELFLSANPTRHPTRRPNAIAEESGRYNLGAVQRTINNPVFPLIFLFCSRTFASISSSQPANPIASRDDSAS